MRAILSVLVLGAVLSARGALLAASAGAAGPTAPEWSIAIYAGTDEAEMAAHTDPIVRELIEGALPPAVEILLEEDTAATEGVRRAYRRGGGATELEALPEHDSADPARLASFLAWARGKARGKHRMLIIMTHSWGWKGIIQDFSIPGLPEEDTMMPLREFARVVTESGFGPDVLFFDSCVLGNAEAIEELKDTAPYLVVSERETPYLGVHYPALFGWIEAVTPTPRELARALPELYVSPFARGGAQAPGEGEYDVVTLAAVDTARWSGFTAEFRELVSRLRENGFRERLVARPDWAEGVADVDSNVDLVELLLRLRITESSPAVRARIDALLERIGYPEKVARRSAAMVGIPESADFEAEIQADELMDAKAAVDKLKARWWEANQDLELPVDLRFEVRDGVFVVSGRAEEALRFRPWLPGVRKVAVRHRKPGGKWRNRELVRSRDYFSVSSFPASSFLLSEAHTQGAPFIHGIGVNLHPLMGPEEERSLDPLTGLSGPDSYRTTRWNRVTLWGDLVLLR